MKTKTAKFIIAAAIAALSLSLAACSEDEKNNDGESSTPVSTRETEASNESEETTAPDESEETTILIETAETTTSNESEETTNPIEIEETTAPDESGEITAANTETSLAAETEPVPSEGKGEAIARVAKEQEGKAFAFGKASPDEGFDNSGLIYYALTANGISCPRTGFEELGGKLDYDALKIGCPVFFQEDNGNVFGGIYIGDGKAVISFSEEKPVTVTDITTNYYREHFAYGIDIF